MQQHYHVGKQLLAIGAEERIEMRVLVADDHELFLKGLEFILSDLDKNIDLVFAKSYSDIFNILAQDTAFDLILTDLAMPGANWEEAISKIHNALPDTPIIILSAVFEREIVQKTIEIGVSGYIPKTSSNAVILGAINLVMSGGVYIPPELLNNSGNANYEILKQLVIMGDNKNVEENIKILTPRQIDVIGCIAKGLSNKQIAFNLGLTEGTVKLHVTAILKLLNVYNRTGAVMEATRLGLIKKNEQA